MVQQHRHTGADVTVGVIEVPRCVGHQFGILTLEDHGRIASFEEKPVHLTGFSAGPEHVYASMGIYCFEPRVLRAVLDEDAKLGGEHDFGKNVMPRMIGRYHAVAHHFKDENKKRHSDIGVMWARSTRTGRRTWI